jgi:chemotaxis protein methyltransferase WspC
MIEPGATDTAQSEIETMLRLTIGLDASTVGGSLVRRAAERRMRKCGAASMSVYASRLAADAQELQALVEEVVVPETYFFREPDAISDTVARAMAQQPLPSAGSPLRVLSVPCSSGEEPFSIAMALLTAGLAPEAIVIDAIDISFAAIARARLGGFRSGSFRGEAGAWMKYFRESEQGWELDDSVRALVRATQGNIVDPAFTPPREQYDVIFCRNLLIYFDADAQARALAALSPLLSANGVLVVGSADSFAVRRAGYEPLPGHERSFLFRLAASGQAIEHVVAMPKPVRRVARAAPHDIARAIPMQSKAARPVAPAIATPRRNDDARGGVVAASMLAEIAGLADGGHLSAALAVGEKALRAGVVSGELLALMGTTYAAVPDLASAERCYRQALFLEPNNEDALLHLSLLLHQRGEAGLASRLRSRARKVLGARAMAPT